MLVRFSVVGAVLAVMALAAAGAPSTDAQCVLAVRWHGATYYGQGSHVQVPIGRGLSHGVVPDCDDTPNAPARPSTRLVVALRKVTGLPAKLAIMVPREGPSFIWVTGGPLTSRERRELRTYLGPQVPATFGPR